MGQGRGRREWGAWEKGKKGKLQLECKNKGEKGIRIYSRFFLKELAAKPEDPSLIPIAPHSGTG